MRIGRHIIVVAAALLLLLGLPLAVLRNTAQQSDGGSGEFVVLINRELHPDDKEIGKLEKLFADGQADGLDTDGIKFAVSPEDAAGLAFAERLLKPDDTAALTGDDTALMLSKAENGLFDVIVMSKELADSSKAETVAKKTNAEMLCVKGET